MKHSIDGSFVSNEESVAFDERDTEGRTSGVGCGGGGSTRGGSKRVCGYSSLINEDGQTKLHLLCQNNSCTKEDVQELIQAFPMALHRRDVYGRSPLFYALKRGCSIDVVKTVFDGYPDAMLFVDFCGDTPLYLLYHPSKDYRILQYVLKQNPSFAIHRERSFSRQSLVNRICAPWTLKDHLPTRNTIQNNATLNDRWTKLVLTVRAAHTHKMKLLSTEKEDGVDVRTSEERVLRELHVALEYSCPPLVLRHFTEMYPEQASMPMVLRWPEYGGYDCYPLHYYLGYSDVVRNSRVVIQSLLSAFPDGIQKFHRGRLPLHWAIIQGRQWEDGIQDLVYAGPEYLDCPDPMTGMIPFLQAATNELSNVTTVYNLLRENPAVLTNLLSGTT